MVDTRIAIVGAGIAGISAAHRLYQNGFKNFVILEAKDQIGGRIRSIKFGQCFSVIPESMPYSRFNRIIA